jgi:hypothetical protein
MRALLIAAIALGMLTLPSSAQDGTASLTGKVQDITGAIIPGFVAELESEQAPGNRFRTVGDAAGVYRFSGLPAGEYDLKLAQAGFSHLTVKSTLILNGEQRTMPDLQLAIGATGCSGDAVLDYIRFLPLRNSTGNLGRTVRLDEGPMVGESRPMSGAHVTLVCGTGKSCGATRTDSHGQFLFKALPPGNFSVRVTNAGYYPEGAPVYKVEGGVEKVYRSIYVERCPLGNCDAKLRPKKPLIVCE